MDLNLPAIALGTAALATGYWSLRNTKKLSTVLFAAGGMAMGMIGIVQGIWG